jgi:DNA-binding response OmpR family regulator
MNIAIVNDNLLIAKLIEMSLKDKSHSIVNIDMATYLDGKFDVVIVDDSLYHDEILSKFLSTRIVIISSPDKVEDFKKINGIWQVIKKPFMPSQLSEIIEKLEIKIKEKKVEPIVNKVPFTQILDKDTIEEIQVLLDNETIECDENDDSDEADEIKEDIMVHEIVQDIEKVNEKRKKRLLKEIFNKNSTQNNKSDGILNALLNMKYKKLKKLLKNAEVNIQIKFPKDKK